MLNRVQLIGYIGKTPEVKDLQNDTKLAKFSVATSESYVDNKNVKQTVTEWHDIIAWKKLAEIIEKYATSGMQVFVEGKLTHRTYEDKDGVKRYVTEIVADTFRILGKKDENAKQKTNVTGREPQKYNPPHEDDDLPF
jgi:single-strand DNA-binding protein